MSGRPDELSEAARVLAGDPDELRFSVHFTARRLADGSLGRLTAQPAGRNSDDFMDDPAMLTACAKLVNALADLVSHLGVGR